MSEMVVLTDLTHLRFRGPDAERYLNGQITQQISGMPLGHSRYTFVCDAKGRILCDGYVYRDEEGFLFTTEGEARESCFARLDRYLIADDCELSDESGRWVIEHRFLAGREEGAVNRFGRWGQDCYRNAEQSLAQAAGKDADRELDRILGGVPSLVDLVGALPAETGWEDEAVSFHKGCYLGQEVVSRMKRAGKTNRKLTQCRLDQRPAELPMDFFASDNPEKSLLTVTSATASSQGPFFLGLGFLSSRYEVGTPLVSSTGVFASLI